MYFNGISKMVLSFVCIHGYSRLLLPFKFSKHFFMNEFSSSFVISGSLSSFVNMLLRVIIQINEIQDFVIFELNILRRKAV